MRRLLTIIMALSLALAAGARDSVATKGEKAGRIAVSVGSGLAINAGAVEVLKHSIDKRRPDCSDMNSMPSRHSAWAFTLATMATNELSGYSPLWMSGTHLVATGIGQQRVMARQHFPADVLAGAAIGVASAELGHFIGQLIFGPSGRHLRPTTSLDTYSGAIDVATGASFICAGQFGDYKPGTAYQSSVRYTMQPIGRPIGLSVQAMMQSSPMYDKSGAVTASMSRMAVMAGCIAQKSYSYVSVYAGIHAGYAHTFDVKGIDVSHSSFAAQAGCGVWMNMSSKSAVGIAGDYMVSRQRIAATTRTMHQISVSIATRACF